MVLCGYDIQKKKCLCLFSLIMNEKKLTYEILFTYLKKKYYSNPRNFIVYFALGQIKAINNVFPECQIHSYFFHFLNQYGKIF